MKAYSEHGAWYCKARVAPGPAGRPTLRLHVTTEAEAQARAGLLGELLDLLDRAGQGSLRERFARELAEAPAEAVPTIERLARKLARGAYAPAPSREILTVQQFAERWTSGRLAAEHPGVVRLRINAAKETAVLRKHVLPSIGELPLPAVRVEDIEAMAASITSLRPSSKRETLRLTRTLFSLAVWPGKQIAQNPVPARLCALVVDRRALAWLRPAEVAALLASGAVPLDRRLLWGVMVHEGLRASEALGLRWSHLDLDRGVVTLPHHKTARTSGARSWALAGGTAAALRRWQAETGGEGAVWHVEPKGLAERLRADLLAAGVDRAELHQTTETARALRAHDLRGTFVTLALAAGRSEAWVMDRTGHTSSAMLGRYRRAARMAAELDLGALGPLDEALWGPTKGGGADTPPPSTCPQVTGNASGGARAEVFDTAMALPSALGRSQKRLRHDGDAPANDNCGQPADSPQACPWVVAGCDRRVA